VHNHARTSLWLPTQRHPTTQLQRLRGASEVICRGARSSSIMRICEHGLVSTVFA
jgi:hypothetical protein